MKILITDICSDCCPVNVPMGIEDRELIDRIRRNVMEKLDTEPVRRNTKMLRTLLIAAVLVTLFVSAAFAMAEYMLHREPVT